MMKEKSVLWTIQSPSARKRGKPEDWEVRYWDRKHVKQQNQQKNGELNC